MGDKKSKKLQIREDILKAGKITSTRNTKASGQQVTKGEVFDVPSMEMSIEDALELVLIGKAVIGGQQKVEAKKDPTVEELKAEAKDLGIAGYHSMNKADLIIAITTAKEE